MKRTVTATVLIACLLQLNACAVAAPMAAAFGGAHAGAMTYEKIWGRGDDSNAAPRRSVPSRRSSSTVLASNKTDRSSAVPLTGAALVVPAPTQVTTGSERPKLHD